MLQYIVLELATASLRVFLRHRLAGTPLPCALEQRGAAPAASMPLRGLAVPELCDIMHDVLEALVFLHCRSPRGVVHRDIKPANILVFVGRQGERTYKVVRRAEQSRAEQSRAEQSRAEQRYVPCCSASMVTAHCVLFGQVGDVGLSRMMDSGGRIASRGGTPFYTAREVYEVRDCVLRVWRALVADRANGVVCQWRHVHVRCECREVLAAKQTCLAWASWPPKS